MSSNNKLEDKLRCSSEMGSVKDSVLAAEAEYKYWCKDNNTNYHQSSVHTFKDTRKQAFVLALTGRSEEQQKTLAKATYHFHQWDDFIDPRNDNVEKFGEFKGDYSELQKSIPEISRKIMQELENDFNTPEKLHGLQQTFISAAYGALIDGSYVPNQEKYCKEHKQNILENITDKKIITDMSKLHPSLTSLIRSTDMSAFYSVSDKNFSDFSAIFSCFYAPMLHCHNGEEEAISEDSKLGQHYGENLMVGKGKFKTPELIKLVEVFDSNIDRHINNLHQGYFTQMAAVYKSFENVLPKELQEKYKATIQNTSEKI